MKIIQKGADFVPDSPIKLIATDMDGSLLDDAKNFPPHFFETMDQLQRQGIVFVAASGRSYSKQREVFEPAAIKPYFLCDNGSLLVHDEQVLFDDYLDEELLHRVIDAVDEIEGAVPMYCGHKRAWHMPVSAEIRKHLGTYFTSEMVLEDMHQISDRILKVALFHPESSARCVYPRVKELFEQEAHLVVSGELWMDIMKIGVNKGKTLQFLQESMGITSEETMVFGDFYNDIEMLQRAKYSFVMANANDDMMQYGNFQAPSNQEYGVQQILAQLVKNNW